MSLKFLFMYYIKIWPLNTARWVMFRYPFLKSTFCSRYHILRAKFCSGCLQILRKIEVFYDNISLFRFLTYLAVIRGQNLIQCINNIFKLTVPLSGAHEEPLHGSKMTVMDTLEFIDINGPAKYRLIRPNRFWRPIWLPHSLWLRWFLTCHF